ncbi:hypothetical protein PHYC_01820 [Phycisphaerales bacterium]|nr:hypothetical protein PHYC_01820 [Phycisphaerales bacterium]
MFELKPIAKEAIPRALSKAERYRLLNEPREAESICRDVLAADPGNQDAIICLILSLTDLFEGTHVRADEVRPLVASLRGEYERVYYSGVVDERWAKSLIHSGYTIASVYDLIHSAMTHFEHADRLAPQSNDDAVLRWNTCVRLLEQAHFTPPEEAEAAPEVFDDDVPYR